METFRTDCDNYDQSVLAIKAIANVIRWNDSTKSFDPNSRAGVGRRLRTSVKNRVSPNTTVTPDLVVVRDKAGHLIEAKVAMSRDAKLRERRLLEIQKYDDELTGWPTDTATVKSHDIVLFLHYTRAVEVIDQLRALRSAKKFEMNRPFAVVSFVINDQRRLWLALELREGAMSDAGLNAKFRKVCSVAVENLSADPQLALMKLYDAPPPLPYLMNLVHETIVNMMSGDELEQLRDLGEVRRAVTLSVLRRAMADRCGCEQSGDGSPEIPQHSWLVDAMDAFMAMGWAQRPKADAAANGDSAADYTYVVKRRKQPMEQFLGHCADAMLEQRAKKAAEELAKQKSPPLAVEWVEPIAQNGSELLEDIAGPTVPGRTID
jgi:hypothetical protein